MRTLTESGDEKIMYLESHERRQGGQDTIYLSSGVHGDEAAAAWGLLIWAERHLEQLRAGRFLIFPCLNPHGLRQNTRTDHRGLDLNRCFHLESDLLCGPWRQKVLPRRLKLALCLHEDYDALGCYVYVLGRIDPALPARLMSAPDLRLPPDPRSRIDGSRAKSGIIHRRTLPTHLPGLPEAVVLWQQGCPLTLTFETPSEMGFEARVETQVAFTRAVIMEVLSS